MGRGAKKDIDRANKKKERTPEKKKGVGGNREHRLLRDE